MTPIITDILVVNLPKCTARRLHIEKLFSRTGVEKYQFFPAVVPGTNKYEHMLQRFEVVSFPPCWQCHEDVCGCENKELTTTQIANWFTYISLMEHIVSNYDEELIMICEDDIQFQENGIKILNRLLTLDSFQRASINVHNPLLIRCGSLYSNFHRMKCDPKIWKNKAYGRKPLANPCFIINKRFAEIFLDNLHRIEVTSDGYIHVKLVKIDSSIQHYTLLPQPIYELSRTNNPEFVSTIKY
tara:strand:- start:8378 stop:9103 length:726 start_codon:yes stop_codon:yes gene_type:complete